MFQLVEQKTRFEQVCSQQVQTIAWRPNLRK